MSPLKRDRFHRTRLRLYPPAVEIFHPDHYHLLNACPVIPVHRAVACVPVSLSGRWHHRSVCKRLVRAIVACGGTGQNPCRLHPEEIHCDAVVGYVEYGWGGFFKFGFRTQRWRLCLPGRGSTPQFQLAYVGMHVASSPSSMTWRRSENIWTRRMRGQVQAGSWGKGVD